VSTIAASAARWRPVKRNSAAGMADPLWLGGPAQSPMRVRRGMLFALAAGGS
jgi:hypothetical protein